jgi:prepilin-type processing-associated H-X9-DG protein
MIHQVVFTERAVRDLEEAYLWTAEQTPGNAVRWYNGFLDTLESLSTNPTRCSLATESKKFPIEVRQLLYGRILPMIESGVFTPRKYKGLYDSLQLDEPWNSLHNAQACNHVVVDEYKCPTANPENSDCTTNYIAVTSPGTAWRKEGPVKSSDLPDHGLHAVLAVEVVNSGIHWAEPRDLMVEEALARLKTDLKREASANDENNPESRISSNHTGRINVLFADSKVISFPKEMPMPSWEKLLAGEVKDVEALSDQLFSEREVRSQLPFLLSLLVWLFSLVLLFRRAVTSRRKTIAVASY